MTRVLTYFGTLHIILFQGWLLYFTTTNAEGAPDMAVVFDPGDPSGQDFIRVLDPPKILQNARISIEYRCTDDSYVGAEVVTNLQGSNMVTVYRKVWRCRVQHEPQVKRVRLRLQLPDALQYNVNVLNKEGEFGGQVKVRVWILASTVWPLSKQDNRYSRAMAKVSYDAEIPPPFSRPFKQLRKTCLSWDLKILVAISSYRIPTCPVEEEVVEVIRYPAAMFGLAYGIYRQFHPYNNPELEASRIQNINNPELTVSLWVYLLEYCSPASLCSIMHHASREGQYLTPLIFLDSEGHLHLQVQLDNGENTAGLTSFNLPLRQWCRVIVRFNKEKWDTIISYGEGYKTMERSDYYFPGQARFDDTEGLFSFGGEEFINSIRGYIGQATIYRRQHMEPEQIPLPSMFHPMFQLGLSNREDKCKSYISWVNHVIWAYDVIRERLRKKRSCENPLYALVQGRRENLSLTCPISGRTRYKHRKLVTNAIKKAVLAGKRVDFIELGNQIFQSASDLLDQGLNKIRTAVPLLKQAACYGNTDAMYKLAVILNHGLMVKQDELQAHAYLMLATLDKHRLSALALGHRHRYGLDGVIEDWEQSYMYYKYVADRTQADKEKHSDTDVYTESVLLTDDEALEWQMDEEGDLYSWLTHQAKQGVLSAQHQIGRALFWGANGLKRNVGAAVEYFKMSAETQDPQSLYDYGLVMVRGQGTEQNVEEGLKHIRKSAEHKNPNALGALGWYAMTYDKNYTAAAEYLEQAFQYGIPEAAFNLGALHHNGLYPGRPADRDVALYYFTYAASRESMAGGTMVAYFNMKGTVKHPRSTYTAVEWARFIAEKNPEIGLVLRKGLQAYRRGDRDQALFYYTMAADAGVMAGTFNLAWLCEQNTKGVTSFIEKECQWRHFNLSTLREMQFVDSYALIKMGDYFWYGCGGQKNSRKAAQYYADAANKGDPQALFNLGFMVEEGATIPTHVLDSVRVPRDVQRRNITLLEHLYTRCKESESSEAFIPCSIALVRVNLMHFWRTHLIVIEVTSFTAVASLAAVSGYLLFHRHFRRRDNEVPNTI